jgi:hypothetical protein
VQQFAVRRTDRVLSEQQVRKVPGNDEQTCEHQGKQNPEPRGGSGIARCDGGPVHCSLTPARVQIWSTGGAGTLPRLDVACNPVARA